MKRERKGIIQQIMCMLTATALLAGSIPVEVNSAQPGVRETELVSDREIQEGAEEEEVRSEENTEVEAVTESRESTEDEPTTESGEDIVHKAPGYVYGGGEKISLVPVMQRYITGQEIYYEQKYQVRFSGFYADDDNEGQELEVVVSVAENSDISGSMQTYYFAQDGTASEQFSVCSSRPGQYQITVSMRGYNWNTEDLEWDEQEKQQQFTLNVEKIEQKLMSPQDTIELTYGDTFDIAAYVEEHMQKENENYSGRLEVVENDADKIQIVGTKARIVSVPENGEALKLKVRYLGDKWFEPSQQVDIPVMIHQGKPRVTLRLQQDSEWQTDRKVQIHDELGLYASISMEEGADYEDLLQNETRLKLQYRIIHEDTGAAKEYIQSFGWNMQNKEKTYQTVLPVGWRYFPKLHKNEKYRIEMAVIYTGTENPYGLPPKQICRITLQAANAYIEPQQEEIKTEYRESMGQTGQIPFSLKHKKLGISSEITSEQELEQIVYGVSTSASDAVTVDHKMQYTGNKTTQIPYTITGVGESDIRIRAVESWTYDVAEALVRVKVANSEIRQEDYRFYYTEDDKKLTMSYSEWREYLKEHQFWLKAPVMIAITDAGAEYYDMLGCYDRTHNTEVVQKDSISYAQGRNTSVPMAEYSIWMEHKSRNASTREMGEPHTFTMGIDQKVPTLIRISDNRKQRYEHTSDSANWYMGENYVLEGTYEDETSGIAQLEYSTDAGRSWNLMQMTDVDATRHISSFKLTIGNGMYQGIAIRAIDTAGNISREYQITNAKGEFINLIVDTRVPQLEIKATKKGSQDSQQGVEEWTNHALCYQYVEKKENPDIYRTFYQYVPVQQVVAATKQGRLPITDEGWKELDKSGLKVGAANAEEEPVDRNGVYYFRTISMCGRESDVVSKTIQLQQTLPELMKYTVTNDRGTQWYHANTALPQVEFACDEYLPQCVTMGEYQAPVTIYRRLTSGQGIEERSVLAGFENVKAFEAYLEDESLHSNAVYQRKMQELALDFINMPDDKYELAYWIEDAAGNRSEVMEQSFWIDTTPPDSIQVWIDGREYPCGEQNTIVYDTFSQTSLHGRIEAQDALSGVKSIRILRAKKFGEWKHTAVSQDGTDFTIEPATRCFLYIEVEDEAGNQTAVWTNGMVVEQDAPEGQNDRELILKPRGANENDFYREDVTVEIGIRDLPAQDNYAALESVSYRIASGNVQAEKELFHGSKNGVSEEELEASASFEARELIDAMQYEGNEVNVEVTARDRAGNEKISTQILKIDVTAPVIDISFDQTQPRRERFYQTARTATIHITERNFDASGVDWEVTRNGEPCVMDISEWTHEDNEHYATMTFTEDGDYTLQVNCKDLADNEAQPVEVEPFTIDQTLPLIEIDYEGEPAYQENYFKSARTAVITVTEHNFDLSDFVLDTINPYNAEEWVHEGDIHRLRVDFRQDDHYIWTCHYTDMAGNMAEQLAQEEFYIDTKAPEIMITGVLDQSANAGEILPVITVIEEHYNTAETQILVTNGAGEAYDVQKSIHTVEGGYAYTLTDMNEQPDNIYYLTVESVDMAGNEASLTYRFSLNRNGSAYDMSLVEQATLNTYYRSAAMTDLEIIEMNVDRIEKFSLYVSRNGILIPTELVENRGQLRDGEICYQVKELGNEQTGYTYIYTLYRENFSTEGAYNIVFYSKDTAGNEVSSTLEDKEAGISFFIDDTAPQAVFDGIESGGIYDVSRRQVNVLFTDNTRLEEAKLHLTNDKGEEINSWDYMEQTLQTQPLTVEIKEYAGGQVLSYSAVDAAGNELRVDMDFVITTNPWIRLTRSLPIAKILTVLAAGGFGLGGVIWYRFRRRRRY